MSQVPYASYIDSLIYGMVILVHKFYNSESAIYFTKNTIYHEKSKHIDYRYHLIREIISQRC